MELRIAVTGLGVCSAGVSGPDALWRRLARPVEPTAGPWPHLDWRGFFAAQDETCVSLAEAAARQALDDGPAPWLILGTCNAESRAGEDAWTPAEAGEPIHPDEVMWPQLPHLPALRLRRALGLSTPAWAVSTACTSGAVAIGAAAALVATGRAPRALAVGSDVISKLTWYGFGSLGLQSSGRCLPFSRARSGLNLGEGAAALLLEPEAAARARGATIYGLLRGYGNATDAWHMSAPEPNGAGAARAIAEALSGGGRPGWVNAHGTGTPLNDAIEARLLTRLFPELPVTASKGALGHTLGAAGALEAVVTLLGLARGEIPPSLAVPDPEPGVDLVMEARPDAARQALSVNLAFGGSNTAILLEAP